MATALPPRPDRSSHDAIKAKYHCLQKKHQDLNADRTRLHEDYAAAKAKLDKLQAETDMLIEQLHPLYPDISLAVDYVDLDTPHAGPSSPRPTAPPIYKRSQIDEDDDDEEATEDELDSQPGQASRARTASSSTSSAAGRRMDQYKHGMLPPDMMLEEEQRIQEQEQAEARKRSGAEGDPSESDLEAAKRIRIGVMPTTFQHETARPSPKRDSKRQRTRSTSSTAAGAASDLPPASSPSQLPRRSKTRSASPLKQSMPEDVIHEAT